MTFKHTTGSCSHKVDTDLREYTKGKNEVSLVNDPNSVLSFLQITWKSMGTAKSPDLQISTSNSRRQVTKPKGSNFKKFS